jgi:hypothetical protein
MASMPGIPEQTKAVVTQRILDHVRRGWPQLGEVTVRFRGPFCYVAAIYPGTDTPWPTLRLRYQESTERWGISIYRASSERYDDSELPFFGSRNGTPEEGVDITFGLYAGPSVGG